MTGFTNTAPPTITGGRVVGGTINATSGTWSPVPASFTYQWERADAVDGTGAAAIPGATGSTYTIDPTDTNKFLRVGVYPSASIAASPHVQAHGVTSIRYDPGNQFDRVLGAQSGHTYFLAPNSTTVTYLDAMKAANPTLRLLAYVSPWRAIAGPYAGNAALAALGANNLMDLAAARAHDSGLGTGGAAENYWLLYNGTTGVQANELGNPVRLLNVGNSTLRSQILTNARLLLSTYPQFDGLFFDEINNGYTTFLLSGATTPLYSGQGTGSTWETAAVGWFSVVGAGLLSDGKYVAANAGGCLPNGANTLYSDASGPFSALIAPYLSGLNLEHFVQVSGFSGAPDGDTQVEPNFYEMTPSTISSTGHFRNWAAAVQYIQGLGKHPYTGNMRRSLDGGTVLNDQNHMLYSRAAFLLSWNNIDGGCWWWFNGAQTAAPYDVRYTTDLGDPVDSAVTVTSNALVPNVGTSGYKRQWTNGFVILNDQPLNGTAINFTLPAGGWVSVHDGLTYAGTYSLPAKRAMIFTKA